MDDGSTDGTGDILRGINDIRVKLFSQEKTGAIAKNMNKALRMSCGNIITIIDGDDYWPENKLEIQVKSFNDEDVVLSYGECFLMNSQDNKIGYAELPKDASVVSHN